jgi:SAM-dependent methyltransferase
MQSIDNSVFSANTIWTGQLQEGKTFKYHPSKAPGGQFVCEASDLRLLKDGSYECVLASHSLEHIANPLRALGEWKRVLGEGGFLLLILPHKDGTFDWRRPPTTLDHMIEDYRNNVGEEDLTHLTEILALHDLTKDIPAGSMEQFRQRCLENYSNRGMHHHVFDTRTAVALVDHAAFQVLRVDTVEPFHIVVLARRCEGQPDNAQFLWETARYRRQSPFASDRGAT